MNIFNSFVHVKQLDILGFDKTYRTITTIVLLILLTYFICKPIVTRLVNGRYITFMTYFILSLFTLVTSLLIAIQNGDTEIVLNSIQSVTIFGLGLAIYVLYTMIKKLIQRKVPK